ncbi:conserved hypothetical protein (DUF306) [Formosa agariphila KMM 3901]|uniref:DUF306 domain-containing protein n=1 Tax=Formosa agariphila (strain DSM 15362 / KCTC 12365 / LMG 23005 / KMM 3901 / M-2Alg 35-1) TaxID=1347342 RepID=T2KMW1_FORAG|nr:META domain-containing protein [Formosa agariphila]CDF80242.1 conserved hypothetical protein (DUF306) [Formosa agariphila KMM 3901]
MNYLKHTLLPLIFITIISCNQTKKDTTITTTATEKAVDSIVKKTASATQIHNAMPFFKASGTTEDWTLQLTEDAILFSYASENPEVISFPISNPILAADANVKVYRAETESAQIKIQISMTECIDSKSKTHPYTVSIDYKPNTKTEFTLVKGCGEYITDYRLHDIWVLESINDDIVTVEQFTKELPNLEINTSENTFMGYAGCNTMRGSIFSEQSKIRFKEIITTRKMCSPTNKEAQFIKELERSIQFKIENRRLYLSNPDGNTLTFKKVD